VRTTFGIIAGTALFASAIARVVSADDVAHSTAGVISSADKVQRLALSGFSDSPPARPLQLLFIHHSCGGQWLAAPGSDVGTNSICSTSPSGGDLRARLEQASYVVHEASYGSRIGEHTDLFDWLPKFRESMDAILACAQQDSKLPDRSQNNIVMFKSCFPNNTFVAEGTSPGNSQGPDLTVWNAKAAYIPLLSEFRKHPEVLFVCVTAPPLAPNGPADPLWKRAAKKILGRGRPLDVSAPLAREFNNWLAATNGWLKDYPLTNLVVFDYFDILTDGGASNLSRYATGGGFDSHPSSEGNRKATAAFIPFLNRAVRRAGLSP
jgi:hypothetical protein